MKSSNGVVVGTSRPEAVVPKADCLQRGHNTGVWFRPTRPSRGMLVSAGRKGNRFRVNLTPELLWQTSEFPVEIKKDPHPG